MILLPYDIWLGMMSEKIKGFCILKQRLFLEEYWKTRLGEGQISSLREREFAS